MGNTVIKAIASPQFPRYVAGAATAAAVGGTALNSYYSVEGGHRAIVFNKIWGFKEPVVAEGLHFLIPFLERAVIYDVRSKSFNFRSTSGSRDLQMINIDLRILSHPDPSRLVTTYRMLGTDYATRVLPSIVEETLKSVVAQYNAVQLITMREAVSREIRRVLTQRARVFNIVLDDVAITNISFGREYREAVEAKQVAQQEAERARFIVDKAHQDKKSTILKAEGEAKSATLIGQAIENNPAFIQLRRIEAARDIASTLSSSGNRVLLNSDGLMLNVANDEEKAKEKGRR